MTPDNTTLTHRVKELELMNDYLLRVMAGLVNRHNPENAYNYLRRRQIEFVLGAPTLPTPRILVAEIDAVRGDSA